MKRFNSFKVKDESPASYDGPFYFREVVNLSSRADKPYLLEFDAADADRQAVLFDHRVQHHSILTSGLIVDEQRNLLPQWRQPMRARLAKGSGMLYECEPNGYVSERVRDVLEALDPESHVFLPIDLTLPEGKVERWYKMMWAGDYFGERVAVLDVEANAMESWDSGGSPKYIQPRWALSMAMEPYHFGYLNPEFANRLHLFGTDNLGSLSIFSETLLTKLDELQVKFPKNITFATLGVAR